MDKENLSQTSLVFKKPPRYSKGLLLSACLLALLFPAAISQVRADDSPAVPPADVASTKEESPAPSAEGPAVDLTAATDTEEPAVLATEAAPAAETAVDAPQASAPAEAQPSQSQSVMSVQEKERAIAQMGANQGPVWVWSSENVVEGESRGPNGGPGQFNGGAVVLGGRPTYDPAADWYYLAYKGPGMTDEEARAVFDRERGKWMDEFDPWGVALEMADNKAEKAWADIRNMQAFILRRDSKVWEKIVDDPAGVQWVAQFKGNMSSYVEDAQQEALPTGGTAIQVLPKQDRVAHWGSNQARSIASPETIRAVLVSVEARISVKSDPDAQIGIQVGGDWKFAEEVSKPLWYPGAGLTGIQRLTKDWARYYFVSLTGVQDAMEERAISRELFLESVLPLADMTQPSQAPAQPAPPSQDPAPLGRIQQEPAGQAQPLAKQAAAQQGPTGQAGARQLPKTGSQASSLGLQVLSALLLTLGLGLLGRQKKEAQHK